MQNSWDSDYDSDCSSSDSSFDEEEVNKRVFPYWPKYRTLILSRGFRLDTVRDVREFYSECRPQEGSRPVPNGIDYELGEEALCPDEGLPGNLFRGTQIGDGKKIIVKAVHVYSREYDIIRTLSRGVLREDPRNHTIPVLDLIEFSSDNIVFIVMEEWSPQLITDQVPCCLSIFFAALRQCIEHAVFMHSLKMAHLDISMRNLVTDYNGRYAYIDFELARRFDNDPSPQILWRRGTEAPPECEKGEPSDPYKVDVWALGVLILRACRLTGYFVPELMHVVKPMLNDRPEGRPTALAVLRAFDKMVPMIDAERLQMICYGDGFH